MHPHSCFLPSLAKKSSFGGPLWPRIKQLTMAADPVCQPGGIWLVQPFLLHFTMRPCPLLTTALCRVGVWHFFQSPAVAFQRSSGKLMCGALCHCIGVRAAVAGVRQVQLQSAGVEGGLATCTYNVHNHHQAATQLVGCTRGYPCTGVRVVCIHLNHVATAFGRAQAVLLGIQ